MSGLKEFPHLFSPLKIRHITAKNRIVNSAHADALAVDGFPTDAARRYYQEKAIGGVGLMLCFGSAGVHPSSPARDWNGVELFDDQVIPHLQKFANTIHQYDVPVISQITHRGRRGRSVDRLDRMYGPSPIREPNHRETPHEIDEQTMDEFVLGFADAAWRLKEGNFDGCEVMASHCHLIDQFWTLNANRRADDYGGELPNRLRFGFKVLEAVRRRCGDDFVIGIRMTGNDFTRGGLDNETMKDIAVRLDSLGIIDYYSIVGGTAETFIGEAHAVPDMSFSHATYASLAGSIREVVKVPVITAGRVTRPSQAETILAKGQADLVIMTRALIADPHLPNKAKTGQVEDIRICRGYNEGCIDRIYTGRGVTCVQNAVAGRETELAELHPSETPCKVVVVGAGPAGLEAARVAALRGHSVVLLEKSGALGGQTLIAANAPMRSEYSGAAEWMAAQCRKLGVEIRLDTEATEESVLSESPNSVFIATGARPLRPEIPGRENAHDCWSVLMGNIPEGNRIAVIDEDYGYQGPSVAEFLLDAGKDVVMVTSMEAIASMLGATTRPPVNQRLHSKGVTIHANLHVRAIEGSKLVTENAWSETKGELNGFDAVVYAFGGEAVETLSAKLDDKVDCHVIGDAFAPRTLQHAIMEGHMFARKV